MYSNFFYLSGFAGSPANNLTNVEQPPTHDSPEDNEPESETESEPEPEPELELEPHFLVKTLEDVFKKLRNTGDSSTSKPIIINLRPISDSYQGSKQDSLKTTTDMGILVTPFPSPEKDSPKKTTDAEKPNTISPQRSQKSSHFSGSNDDSDGKIPMDTTNYPSPVKGSGKKTTDAETPNTISPKRSQKSSYFSGSNDDSNEATPINTTTHPKSDQFSNYVFLSAYVDEQNTNSTEKGDRTSDILTPVIKSDIPDM